MKQENKSKLIKLSIIVLGFVAIALLIVLPLKFSGLLDKVGNAEELKQIISNGGIYSYLIFFAIQFLQATFLPIPAMVTTITGTLIFGPFVAFLISFISVMAASLFSFFLGKKFGKKFIVWAIGESDFQKWSQILTKGKYGFFLMMLFPLFPDDILCLVAGAATTMTYKFFIITNLITRPIGILAICYLASGQLIPFSGWGIPVWIILAILCVAAIILSFKYQNKIENFMTKFTKKSNTDSSAGQQPNN